MTNLELGQNWVAAQFIARGVLIGDWRRSSGGLNYDLWRLSAVIEGKRISVPFNEQELKDCGAGDAALMEAVKKRIQGVVARHAP